MKPQIYQHVVAEEVAKRLIARLDYMKLQPKRMLDLGGTVSYCNKLLSARYPDADVMGLDISEVYAGDDPWPIQSGSIDLIIANLLFPWRQDLSQIFSEVKRLLSRQGTFLFTTLGPDTHKELRASWTGQVDRQEQIPAFCDLHDIGDALLQADFADPVMDMEIIRLRYRKLQTLIDDLRASGDQRLALTRRKTLTGKQRWQDFVDAYQQQADSEGRLPASYEIIYGHAWQAQPKQKKSADGSEISIPLESIGFS